MGYDTVSIVSMNSARKGLFSLPKQAQGSYLNQLLNGMAPDIGLLPGDNKEIRKNVIMDYDQYMAPNNEDTLLLYDANKIAMAKQNISVNAFGPLPELDNEKLVWPVVEVSSLMPTRRVIKTFSLVTWHYSLFSETDVSFNERLLNCLVIFAQRLALTTGNPILIAGEFRISYNAIHQVVSRLNNSTQEQYLEEAHADLSQHGYLPSMTKSSLRDVRHLFKMNSFLCKREPIVKSWESQQTDNWADCFIASKALEMTEAKGIQIEEALGQQIKLKPLKEACVTKSEMRIPDRPPKHHGG